MKAVVLVGGEGTRLRPLTYTMPKQLLPIVEVPMLERVLCNLARNDVDEAVLSLGYRPDAFMSAYPDSTAAGIRLSYAVEPEPLDTAGAIRFAAQTGGVDSTFIALNGDVLTDLDIGALLDLHRRRRAMATLHLTPVEDPSRFGVVVCDGEGRVLEFIEKPAPGSVRTNLINAGTYVLEPEVLAQIPEGRRSSIERETFPALAEAGALYALASDAYWIDTGTPEAYLQAHRDLLSGRRGRPPAPGARETGDGSWLIGEVQLQGQLSGGSLAGEGSSVGAGALVRTSVVGGGCVVGEGALVEDSVLIRGATLGKDARVTSSVVGPRADIGPAANVAAMSVIGEAALVPAGAQLEGARLPSEAGS